MIYQRRRMAWLSSLHSKIDAKMMFTGFLPVPSLLMCSADASAFRDAEVDEGTWPRLEGTEEGSGVRATPYGGRKEWRCGGKTPWNGEARLVHTQPKRSRVTPAARRPPLATRVKFKSLTPQSLHTLHPPTWTPLYRHVRLHEPFLSSNEWRLALTPAHSRFQTLLICCYSH